MVISKRDHIQELKDSAEKLLDLLSDPHPGLLTWREALDARLADLDLYSAGTHRRFEGLAQIYPEFVEQIRGG